MKLIYSKLILIACSIFFSFPALAQPLINCDFLHGSWSGEHTDSRGNYARWTASYSEEGGLSLMFFDVNGNQVSTQEGRWECDDNTLTTTMFSGVDRLSFDYNIVSLDQMSFSYQSLHDGTVFQSLRLKN